MYKIYIVYMYKCINVYIYKYVFTIVYTYIYVHACGCAVSMCMLPGVLHDCNGCVVYDALGGLRALEWVQSVQCSGYTECITLGVVGTMLWVLSV